MNFRVKINNTESDIEPNNDIFNIRIKSCVINSYWYANHIGRMLRVCSEKHARKTHNWVSDKIHDCYYLLEDVQNPGTAGIRYIKIKDAEKCC